MRTYRLCLCAFLLAGCGRSPEPAVKVAVAVSARDPVRAAADRFQAEQGTAVEVEGGASSTLARQVENGSGADLFLSADERWADYLAERGLVAERRDLLGNRLVVVVPGRQDSSVRTLADLAGPAIKRLALAGPEVPAGRYARDALRNAGVWDRVRDRVITGANVRITLAYVARGEAEAGLVYRTDALSTDEVETALEVKENLHQPIRYPLVLLKREPLRPAVRVLYDYLHSEAAAAEFRRAGFDVLP
jgi:molybdate transport system substrate-binding protein